MENKRECPICSKCGFNKFQVIENNTTDEFIKIQCLKCFKITLI
ncbi:MAG: hypothetical protein ACXWE0_09245 [Nitrososphaeraceae archaeon]